MNTLNLQQAAEFLHLHPVTLQRMAQRGEVSAAKLGRRWVFLEIDLVACLRAKYPSRVMQGEHEEVIGMGRAVDNNGYDCRPGMNLQGIQQQPLVDCLIPRKTVEKLSGLSRATIYRLMQAGKFPRPLSIGTGSVRWRQSDVIAWQQSLAATV